jgi:hypothetical protein
MQLQLRSLDKASRRELTTKVNLYKSSLKGLEDDYERARQAEERSNLLGDPGGDGISVRDHCIYKVTKFTVGSFSHVLSFALCMSSWSAENSAGACKMRQRGIVQFFTHTSTNRPQTHPLTAQTSLGQGHKTMSCRTPSKLLPTQKKSQTASQTNLGETEKKSKVPIGG